MSAIQTFPLGPLQTNCYLLANQGQALVVDPGGAPDPVLRFASSNNLQIREILNTHLHFDHLYGNQALHLATKAPIRVPEKDVPLLASGLGSGNYMGLPKVDSYEYETISAGDTEFIGLQCRVLHTPGHSPGSLSYYFPDLNAVFVGDVLFAGSIGRTDFFGGDMETLLNAVRSQLFTLPQETIVYPGHGPATTVREEQLTNPYFED
ncbi:Glyoxylase, beta-lactamase superfamily II [Desulfonatronum thiosulfatophilum]|uniref:Glyoxylase, beta-lactamase superfamily II n=1 Tax=Desulfonatronum thiosulfatophilum TaxID=617002 RepID=A0A1G6EH96_9BACT|nr:MBL fold metallo-hydrolase [Desulfonatronum thiosulfatophilum]SDB56781.1 Glyoxylase, beta-lactamase superfamily II [Desulfonatronum thiosulfatophilum]